jgi:hypothetical protein
MASRRPAVWLGWMLVLLLAGTGPGAAEPCTAEALRKVVEDTGRALRRLHTEAQPRLAAGFRRLKELHGWSEEEHVERAMLLAGDQRSEVLDAKAAELLARLDRLADDATPGNRDCARLADLEAAALELQATVRAKTEHTLARLGQLAKERTVAAAPEPPPTAPADTAPPALLARPAPPLAPPPPAKTVQPPSPKTQTGGWTTVTREDPVARERAPVPPTARPPALPPPSQEGFSIDEIRDASRGFFGTISAGLGGVIEHAFAQAGRPTGYVLGNEGGGAFIAGVRYGSGRLYTRDGKTREVFWHGPSIGYDFGASGSKVLFLVYGLRNELDIFSGFTGIEGSAYLVGGVGLTFVTDGRVTLAPIRSGLGLRLGANIGYLRFTARPTWNPF